MSDSEAHYTGGAIALHWLIAALVLRPGGVGLGNAGRVLATAGGVVLNGECNGWFKAFDSRSGKELWKYFCGAGVNSPAVSYGQRQAVHRRGGGRQHAAGLQAREQRVRLCALIHSTGAGGRDVAPLSFGRWP